MLGLLAVAGSAITTGVLLAVAVSLVPVFRSLAPDSYVRAHKVAGRHFDRFMPPTVLATAVVDIALVALSHPPSTVLFGCAVGCLAGVSGVSQFGNVPINRVVKALPADGPPPGWDDPRPRWRTFHLWRTSLAATALLSTAWALYLMTYGG